MRAIKKFLSRGTTGASYMSLTLCKDDDDIENGPHIDNKLHLKVNHPHKLKTIGVGTL